MACYWIIKGQTTNQLLLTLHDLQLTTAQLHGADDILSVGSGGIPYDGESLLMSTDVSSAPHKIPSPHGSMWIVFQYGYDIKYATQGFSATVSHQVSKGIFQNHACLRFGNKCFQIKPNAVSELYLNGPQHA